ncbi:MAG TPA: FAD-binding oxidoreductase [Verrucomicrobiae bacterium]|jgi:ferredoxin-NADP reductase|nr:FAD-binding oxidoreductase [Verrucomicrobiae bacterium]
MPREALEMKVESVTIEVPAVKSIRLKWPDGHNPEFKTGQFMTCYWPDEPNYKRAYSLSSSALDRGFYEITVRRDGKMGTRIVDWIKPEQTLMVLPPAGKFLPEFGADKHLVCIAGGSGVTPFRAFAREATRRKLPTRLTLLYSVRTGKEVIFDKEFNALAAENPNFKFLVTCTRLEPEDPWAGRRGRIDATWVREQIGDLANTVFYACGPTTLVEFAEGLVFELGIPKSQVKTEKWG